MTALDPVVFPVIAERLGHPFHARRKTDPYLARAVLQGGTGRIAAPKAHPLAPAPLHLAPAPGHWSRALWERAVALVRRGETPAPKTYRRWPLWRSRQVDQGNTPWCVDATRVHLERAVPTIMLRGLPLGEGYAAAKTLDGWPNEDGTSWWAMVEVMRQWGAVAEAWWWTGPQDNEALVRWLVDRGPVAFGASWSESMFRTRQFKNGLGEWTTDGVVECQGPFAYGHETLLIGRTHNYRRMGPHIEGVQSWGSENYGIDGRFWIPEQVFFDVLMNPDLGWGDACGVVEAPRL